MASSFRDLFFRDLFCGCFLSHICTSCTQEGWPLFTSCREVVFSETSASDQFWLSFSRCSMRPLGQRVSFLLVLYSRLGVFEGQLVYMLVPDLLALPK